MDDIDESWMEVLIQKIASDDEDILENKEIFEISESVILFQEERKKAWFLHCNIGMLHNIIHMRKGDFKRIMVLKFSAQPLLHGGVTYIFLKEEHAQKALEWVESQYVALKLTENNL